MIIDKLTEKPIRENFESQSYLVGVHTNEEGKNVVVLYPQSEITQISKNAQEYAEAGKKSAMEAIKTCKTLYDGNNSSGSMINIPNDAFVYAQLLFLEGATRIENKILISSGLCVKNNGILHTIPKCFTALKNYGHGAGNGYNNSLDLEKGVYTERCALFVPEQAVTYNEYLTYFLGFGFDIPMERYDEYVKAIETVKCSHSELTFEYWEVVQNDDGKTSSGAMRVKLNGVVPSEKELQAFIDEQRAAGTPVVICYGIPDPIETDISDLETEIYIPVTPGGTISFDGSYGTVELYIQKNSDPEETIANMRSDFSNALRGYLLGTAVSATDVSPIEHELGVKVSSKNIIPFPFEGDWGANTPGKTVTNNGVSYTFNEDASITVKSNGVCGTAYSSVHLIGFAAATEYVGNILEDGETYTISAEVVSMAEGTLLPFVQLIGDKGANYTNEPVTPTGIWAAAVNTTSTAFTYKKGAIKYYSLRIGANAQYAGKTIDCTIKVQLEKGSTATAITPYIADVEGTEVTVTDGENTVSAIADADGNVTGLRSMSPGMTLTTGNEGVLIECEYNRDANKVISDLEAKLNTLVATIGG